MIGTSAGATPRTTDEVPRSNRPDDGSCTFCRADADGVDAAREGNPPVCSSCAKIRTDGGLVDCGSCPYPLTPEVGVEHDGEFYHPECAPDAALEDWDGEIVTDGGVTSYETELKETHDCGTNLVRVDSDDPENTHGADVVVCPACLEIVRKEGSV